MAEREKYVVFKKNFKVDILPKFVDIFVKTKHISCKKELTLNHILFEHGRSHYLLRPPRKRKYDRKLPEELLTERNDFFKKIVDQSKEMTKMSKELQNYEEAKE